MVNIEKGHEEKMPVLTFTVIINVGSNGGSRGSGSSGTVVPMMSRSSDKIHDVV